MRTVKRSALVPYTAAEMFALVADVESYPQFLPWCSDATVHDRRGDLVDGSVEMYRSGFRRRFRTLNTLRKDEAIEMSLVDGPFSELSGGWRFLNLGDEGCKVSFELEFEFESRATDALIGPFFEHICNSLVDAFVQRAHEVYGVR